MSATKILIIRFTTLIWTTIFVIGCTNQPNPDHYGVFAVEQNRLKELNHITKQPQFAFNENESINDDLNGDAYFIIYGDFGNPRLIEVTSNLKYKSRYELDFNTHPDKIVNVPFNLSPLKGEKDMITLKPKIKLKSGLYALSVVGCPDNAWDFRCNHPFRVR
ncbi:hypothetical protein BMS3Abin15_01258 [bacterium BMS3Abin15]|nr:hypothetical protein BMS3Abin15_01258 [bacterium BMS3Abin15]